MIQDDFENLLSEVNHGNASLSRIKVTFDDLLKGLLSLDTSKGPG